MEVGSSSQTTALVARLRGDVVVSCRDGFAPSLPAATGAGKAITEGLTTSNRQHLCRYGSSMEAVHERHVGYSENDLLPPEPHPQKNPYRRTDKPGPHFVSFYA